MESKAKCTICFGGKFFSSYQTYCWFLAMFYAVCRRSTSRTQLIDYGEGFDTNGLLPLTNSMPLCSRYN